MNNGAIGYIVQGANTVNIDVSTDSGRIRKFALRKNMLNDNFFQQVYEELGRVVVSAKDTGLIDQIDDTNNIFKMVIDEISKAYKEAPVRIFSNEAFEKIYSDLNIDEVMRQSNVYMNAFNDVLLQVGVDDGKATLRLRTPDNTIIRHNDLDEVYVYGGVQDDLQIWFAHTKDEFYTIYVESVDEVLNSEHEKHDITPNELGYLPFIVLHNGYRDGDFWQMYKGDDLIKSTIQVAIKMTMLNQLIKYQSFKQLVATSEQGGTGMLDNVTLDPASIIYMFGEGSELTTLDLESNYKQLQDTIKDIVVSIATNYKISPSTFRLTGIPSSGFALQMENLKLDNFIIGQQTYFKNIEIQLFEMISDVMNIKGDMEIAFVKPSYPKSTNDILQEQIKSIELGKLSVIDIMMDEQGLSEDEAIAQYAKNIELRNKANEKLNTPIVKEPNIRIGDGN